MEIWMRNKKIVVVGIFVTDLSFYSKKIPSKGETIIGNKYTIGPGGKGSNQVIACLRSGGEVYFIAQIGDDEFGSKGLKLHQSEGTYTEGIIIKKGGSTGAATISIDEKGMNSIVVVPGVAKDLSPKMIQEKKSIIRKSSILLTGFEVPLETAKQSLILSKESNLKTILNPAPYIKTNDEIWPLVDYLTPNEHEATSITGIKVKDPITAFEAGRKLCKMGVQNAIITLGSLGAVYVSNQEDTGKHFPPPYLSEKVIDTVGAGDVFNGAFSTALAENAPISEAIEFANKAAAISVRKSGAALSSPKREDINKIL